MKRKNEKVPGFDEIVFENRNKEYGAYDIRKKYLPAGIWSAFGGIFLFSAVITGVFLTEKNSKAEEPLIHLVKAAPDPSITDPNKIKVEVPPAPKQDLKSFKYVPPKVVDKIDSSGLTMQANAVTDSAVQNRPVDTALIAITEHDPAAKKDPEIYYYVPEMPQFPGGNDGIIAYLNDNLKYPQTAIENGIEGKVVLRFVVWTDGSIRKIEVLRSVDPVLDQEAIRVISQMPKWKPGKNNGTPALVWYSLPVTFRIHRN